MLLILHTTGECNLKCDYCGGSFSPSLVPWKIKYDLDDLKRFVRGVEGLTIAFYGGEPLLNPRFIMKVMDEVSAERFVIQTNGLLTSSLPDKYWMRFDSILLSIDGVEELTDKHRGRGVYRAVIYAVRWLRKIGYMGDIVARMTAVEDTDIYRDVTHLLKFFDHVHWQLDFIWSDRWDDAKGWLNNVYKPGLRKLMDLWLDEMDRGNLLGIAPFQGILKRIKEGGPAPPCGAAVDSFSVSTDGRVLVCPIAVQEKWAYLGSVGNLKLGKLSRSMIGEPCTSCDYYRICGGRCLYTYKERFWGEEGFRLACETNKYIIDLVMSKTKEIEGLVEEEKVSWGSLLYPSFNNTIEIMP